MTVEGEIRLFDKIEEVAVPLRDYLIAYLADDADLLDDLAHTAIKVSWADELWTYIRTVRPLPPEQQKRIATSPLQVAQLFLTIPIWKQDSRDSSTWRFCDLTNTDRLRLLLEWSTITCQSALERDPLSACKRGSDSLLMEFGGCLAL